MKKLDASFLDGDKRIDLNDADYVALVRQHIGSRYETAVMKEYVRDVETLQRVVDEQGSKIAELTMMLAKRQTEVDSNRNQAAAHANEIAKLQYANDVLRRGQLEIYEQAFRLLTKMAERVTVNTGCDCDD